MFKTDNGPPFQREDFKQLCAKIGTTDRKITLYWPEANASAERFMRTMGKAIRTAVAECKKWKSELSNFFSELYGNSLFHLYVFYSLNCTSIT